MLLLDSIGDLAALFERADVVFMGGTLAPRGGHNILEPAAFAKPIVVGPHMENFREIRDLFAEAQALVEIDMPEAEGVRGGSRDEPPVVVSHGGDQETR